MIVKSLEQMEKIVSNNNRLSWIGWDVIELIPSKTAMFENNGVYKNNTWSIQKTYKSDSNGWNIPDKYKVNE